jgi:hypothetical protein
MPDGCLFSSLEYTQFMEKPVAISDLADVLHSAHNADQFSVVFDTPYLVVDVDYWNPTAELPQPTCPVIALAEDESNLPPIIDLIATSDSELTMLTDAIRANPVASAILVQQLRHNELASVTDGLFSESLSYSCLQHGSRFREWLAQREPRQITDEEASAPVLTERQNDNLTITLNRPQKRNAYSAGLRDALYEALALVAADHTIKSVVVQGAGECFSAGGDLDEFGEATDAALAHMVRMTRSTGLLLDQLKSRTKFRLHGACIGAGIELPSFSDSVVATPDSFFQLPEVAMGLIPGAGGTVSILRRIGRLRTAFMAISNQRISSKIALEWGLIDEIT